MAISEVPFDSEQELHDWAISNIHTFLPNAIVIPGFQVTTSAGKKGVPDGFAFSFHDREWFVIESELLAHGVWPHIAEQIVRFVVAMQNPQSRRKVRDRVFEHLINTKQSNTVEAALETTPERLLQQIELFIEGIPPEIVMFIDDTNQDLHDMAQALSASSRVFRIQKFIVNGQAEYHSRDRNTPLLTMDTDDDKGAIETDYDIIELLGGGQLEATPGKFKCYRLNNPTFRTIRCTFCFDRGRCGCAGKRVGIVRMFWSRSKCVENCVRAGTELRKDPIDVSRAKHDLRRWDLT